VLWQTEPERVEPELERGRGLGSTEVLEFGADVVEPLGVVFERSQSAAWCHGFEHLGAGEHVGEHGVDGQHGVRAGAALAFGDSQEGGAASRKCQAATGATMSIMNRVRTPVEVNVVEVNS
jgi:hypothetical protein